MSSKISLREAEQEAFAAAHDDGLWDILIGCVVLMFAIAPLLPLGDFWSSAVFVPFWAAVFVVARLVRKRVLVPRIGVVQFGRSRRARMLRFNLVALAVGVIGLTLGVISARDFGIPGWMHMARFGLVVLTGFSVAAYFLGFPRLYLYGVLIVLSLVVGEWLYARMGVAHHGFPITFGTTAGIMMVTGLWKFARLLRDHPVPVEGPSSGEA